MNYPYRLVHGFTFVPDIKPFVLWIQQTYNSRKTKRGGKNRRKSLWEICWNYNCEESYFLDEIEVIGNIHDNKELLREE